MKRIIGKTIKDVEVYDDVWCEVSIVTFTDGTHIVFNDTEQLPEYYCREVKLKLGFTTQEQIDKEAREREERLEKQSLDAKKLQYETLKMELGL